MNTLTMLNKSTKKDKGGHYLYAYQCFCGKQFYSRPYRVKVKIVKSCGCSQYNGNGRRLKDPKESSFRALYAKYKADARFKKRDFDLSREQFRLITKELCTYCGKSPKQRYLANKGRKPYTYNGIDRYDNKKGYTLENSKSCCSKCNYFKSDMDGDDFKAYIKKIHSHLKL